MNKEEIANAVINEETLEHVVGGVEEAVQAEQNGKPSIDESKCVRCGVCVAVCPANAIHNYVISTKQCINCGSCSAVCPVNAIK